MLQLRGSTQRANQTKPTQKVKASTARTAPLVAKGMTRAQLNFFEMTKTHEPAIESSTRPRSDGAHEPSIESSTQSRDRTEGGAVPP